jgi:hypothetical protein
MVPSQQRHQEAAKNSASPCLTLPSSSTTMAKHTMKEWTSKVVDRCQICGNKKLESIIFLGYLPPVNTMNPVGEKPHEQGSYPAEMLYCAKCQLIQLGLIVNPKILFPVSYPYLSSVTRVLRDNFTELYKECSSLFSLQKDDLVIDIGSNDGNLLINFKDKHRVLGITPEGAGKIAIQRGIPTILDYFTPKIAKQVKKKYGLAKIVTATNVFAHIDDVNEVVESILTILEKDGIFITESHYVLPLLKMAQYDTIYHEHLRYYSLHALQSLFKRHDLKIIHSKKIPTHGGSLRTYVARKGTQKVRDSVATLLAEEKDTVTSRSSFDDFKARVVNSKLQLNALLADLKSKGKRIYGISSPSRAITLINYVGIDDGIIDYVLELPDSHKIGKYIPGTLIPVVAEDRLWKDQPDYAILFSWHIADELAPKLRAKGFKGDFIVPLPEPRILSL